MATGPMERLHLRISRNTRFTTVPDIDNYHRIMGPRAGSCMFRGCTEPVTWEGSKGSGFLCEGHYLTMKKWVTEARAGYAH